MYAPSATLAAAPLVAALHKTPLDAATVFSFYASATPYDAVKSAVSTAAIHGYVGAFSTLSLLEGAPPIPELPSFLGGLPDTPASPGLRELLSRPDPAKPPFPGNAAAPRPPRKYFGLSPRPDQPPAATRRSLFSELAHEELDGPAHDADLPPAPPVLTAENEIAHVIEAAQNTSLRRGAMRTFTEFFALFPLTRQATCPTARADPIAVCALLPLPVLLALADAASQQYYGLLLVRNTAAQLKNVHGASSAHFSNAVGTNPAFDANAARLISDGTITIEPRTPLEDLLQFTRVGHLALAIAMPYFISGATALGKAVITAAERLTLTLPNTGPNVLHFETLLPLSTAVDKAVTAGATFDCDIAIRHIATPSSPSCTPP